MSALVEMKNVVMKSVLLPFQECRSEQAFVCYLHIPLILFNHKIF